MFSINIILYYLQLQSLALNWQHAVSGQSSMWAKVCEHVRSFLRTKLTPCLLLLLAYKPCSLLSSSVNLPTSLFQVESYNSIFLSDYVCQVIQRSSFFLQNQFRER